MSLSAEPAFTRLQERVSFLIEHARMQHPLGVVGYTPAAFGEAYKALYLRDFTYMAESAPEFIPGEHIRAIIALFVSHLSPEGLCPERISNDGEVIYICHGPKPAADSPMFLAKLCAAYAGNGGDREFLAQIYPALARTLATTPQDPSTGLVWIDPATPHTGYGFTDTIAITGRHFYCSLLLFEACRILARLARTLGLESEAGRHEQQADRIRSNLDLFWSADDALYLAGSQDCRQADVWGSAYACVIGALPEARRKEVARSLWEKRDRFLWRGHVRHLLLPEFWQRLTVESDYTGPNQFQNGPYWGTATGWMAEAFESVQPGEGFALLHDLIADFEMNGIWECIGPDGYQRIANNVSSAALPYASYKRLLQRPA
jgi:glycogen debranching enzyme